MNAEFIEAIGAISKEKGIPTEVLFETVESAVAAAYKKNYIANCDIYVTIERESGVMKVYERREIVEEVEDPGIQISLEEASP